MMSLAAEFDHILDFIQLDPVVAKGHGAEHPVLVLLRDLHVVTHDHELVGLVFLFEDAVISWNEEVSEVRMALAFVRVLDGVFVSELLSFDVVGAHVVDGPFEVSVTQVRRVRVFLVLEHISFVVSAAAVVSHHVAAANEVLLVFGYCLVRSTRFVFTRHSTIIHERCLLFYSGLAIVTRKAIVARVGAELGPSIFNITRLGHQREQTREVFLHNAMVGWVELASDLVAHTEVLIVSAGDRYVVGTDLCSRHIHEKPILGVRLMVLNHKHVLGVSMETKHGFFLDTLVIQLLFAAA